MLDEIQHDSEPMEVSMSEEKSVDVEVQGVSSEPQPQVEIDPQATVEEEVAAAEAAAESTSEPKKEKTTRHLKEALRQVESFGQALSEALQGRGNVVMVRVNDEALEHLDMLVEAEITKSRSESAAFLISEGIRANEALFSKISAITDQIAELREQLREEVKLEPYPDDEAED